MAVTDLFIMEAANLICGQSGGTSSPAKAPTLPSWS
jgi:hypothetical protein